MFAFPNSFLDNLIGDDFSWWEQTISENKVSYEFMKYVSQNLSPGGISVIRKAIQNGLDENIIKKFVKKDFLACQMAEILEGFLLGPDYYHLVDLYCSPEFSTNQMFELRRGIRAGLSYEQIKSIAVSEMSDNQIREKRKEFIYYNQRNKLNVLLSHLT